VKQVYLHKVFWSRKHLHKLESGKPAFVDCCRMYVD